MLLLLHNTVHIKIYIFSHCFTSYNLIQQNSNNLAYFSFLRLALCFLCCHGKTKKVPKNSSNKEFIKKDSYFRFLQSFYWEPSCLYSPLQRGEVPLYLSSASVSDNSGNSPQMAPPRRLREINQSTQRFHVGCDNR